WRPGRYGPAPRPRWPRLVGVAGLRVVERPEPDLANALCLVEPVLSWSCVTADLAALVPDIARGGAPALPGFSRPVGQASVRILAGFAPIVAALYPDRDHRE